MSELSIREIIHDVTRGQIRIPAFQRGFVWDPDTVAFFMDSLFKRYPVGNLLLWRTKEQLNSERTLGAFELPRTDPDYPIDYVLDGQQRITSLFGVFQTELDQSLPEIWTNIYFDFQADPDAQESQFFALEPEGVDLSRYFPLNSLFDTVKYRRATQSFDDETLKRIDEMQTKFKEARIPVEYVTTDDKATVALVFERVNRKGVPLDTLQLLSAWTWSDDFQLQGQFEDLKDELVPFGFEDVGMDTDLLLRCCAGVLVADASASSLVNIRGSEVRRRFQEVVNGVKGAIDFLQTNLEVYSLDSLPYPGILVPLTVFFAALGNQHVQYTDDDRRVLIRWFWRCCFSKRYSGGILRNLRTDIAEVLKLKRKNAADPTTLGDFSASVTPDFFSVNTFRIGTVNTKTFILLLAQQKPRSFISGVRIVLRDVLKVYNRNEFHHIYPRDYLDSNKIFTPNPNCLANFCFMSKQDNVQLGGVAPSQYRLKMPNDVNEILQLSFCPPMVFADNFAVFVSERSQMLASAASALII
ncbi:MAG: DUF262 domain-containing protein [Anaerolineaceae bacterium]|nr:DUF262 domain-containing protein [Anaerolineaceae bacterium]